MRRAARDDTNIIFGATIDERLTGQVWVTVVATGLAGVVGPKGSNRIRRETDPLEPPVVPYGLRGMPHAFCVPAPTIVASARPAFTLN